MTEGRETINDEREYVHILDKEGRCSCGTFAVAVDNPHFTQLAAVHFMDTREVVQRSSAGERTLLALILLAGTVLLVALGFLILAVSA